MLSAQSVREHMQQLVAGVVCLDDFEDWLIAASWNMHQHADGDLQRLVGAIELRLAEHSSGHLDLEDLTFELRMLLIYGCPNPTVQMPVFSISFPGITPTVSSTFQDAPIVERVVMAVDRTTSSETRSASTRTVTAREALELAS